LFISIHCVGFAVSLDFAAARMDVDADTNLKTATTVAEGAKYAKTTTDDLVDPTSRSDDYGGGVDGQVASENI
jgi:hypothetical protein